jgi:hypothetical protein
MIGKKFNKWTVADFSHKKNGNSYYHCVCDCSNTSIVKDSNLRHNGSVQCASCASKIRGKKGIYAQNEGSGLYVIRCESYYKIGTTKNIAERVRTIKAGNPFELEVMYYGLGKGEMEEYWHEHFKDKHHEGEWYCLDESDVESIKSGGCSI